MKRMHLQLGLSALVVTVAGSVWAATLPVNCHQPGQTITQALRAAKPGDTIQVSGTCEETLQVTTDRITLDGQGAAVIDGGGGGAPGLTFEGVITVDGAQGVIITGFTVRHGAADGITGRRGAAFTVRDTVVEDNADDGIQAGEFASVELIDCTVRGSGEHGIVVTSNSSARFQGAIKSSENARYGIFVFGSSQVNFLAGATIQTHDNGVHGILIATGGSAITSAEINTHDNQFGVTVAIGATLQGSGGAIDATQNGVNGLQVGNGATVALIGTTVNLEDNGGTGLNVVGSSRVLSTGALTIQNNANVGVSVNDSSVALTGTTTIDNDAAVTLAFGARATFSNPDITGTITCDETVLLQGAVCGP